ncbi:MAG: hypothetical protein V7734_08500 [Maribacter arcticus]|uniref:hypothetical protein n=1 Tax=Maribacter arcticus TaxID=561365 RepID=UPI0030018F96
MTLSSYPKRKSVGKPISFGSLYFAFSGTANTAHGTLVITLPVLLPKETAFIPDAP